MKQRKIIFTSDLFFDSLNDSFKNLTPQFQIRNPVIFVTYLGALFTTLLTFLHFSSFNLQIALWLWFTVLFANFASAIAESRGKAQAASLRKTQTENYAKKLLNGEAVTIPATDLKKGDKIYCEVGDIIPADGEVIEGIATV